MSRLFHSTQRQRHDDGPARVHLATLCPARAAAWSKTTRGGILLLLLLFPQYGRADIYSHIDDEGVIHYTNIPRPGRKWKRIMKTGPGKASTTRGSTVDRIPPSDRSPARFRRYDQHLQHASALYRIPVTLIRAVIHVESDFDPQVVSHAGAQGLMQLMPQVARSMGVKDTFDPRQNIFGGTRFLRILANTFGGDLVKTLAGYHAGPNAVKKYGGIPPYATTQKYVRMVLKKYFKLRAAVAQN